MPISSETALLDTNVLVYAYDTASPHHARCRALRDRAVRGEADVCLAPQVLFEFFAVVTNPSRVASPVAAQVALSEMEKLSKDFAFVTPPSDVHERVVALLRQTGFGSRHVYDVVMAATLLANGLTNIYTYDAERFSKIPGVTVLTP